VFSLIKTGIRPIGGIHATAYTVIKYGSHECYSPFWSVESHNVKSFPFGDADSVHGLGEADYIVIVFVPGPFEDFTVSFNL
jgi:hypothetical protein